MTILLPVAAPAAPVARGPAILSAAQNLLLHLERGERIDTPLLRAAMETAFCASDAAGAWDWKTAYEAGEIATTEGQPSGPTTPAGELAFQATRAALEVRS